MFFLRRVLLVSVSALLTLLCGCSRIETIRVQNHYSRPVRVRLDRIHYLSPIVAAGEILTLPEKEYMGGGDVTVTVFSVRGTVLFHGDIKIPGDSATRSFADIVVGDS